MSPQLVVFLGVATLDTIALVDHAPATDERLVAESLVHAGGGPAATAAVTAARLGLPAVHFVGTVGTDSDGDRLLAELAAEGVDVSGVTREPGHPTGASVVIADRSHGTRSICTRPLPPLQVPRQGRGAQLLAAASWVHVDQLGWPCLAALQQQGVAASCEISVDCGNPIVGYRPHGVALDVPTEESLLARYATTDLDRAMARSIADGARLVVVTRGGAGSVALSADGERVEVGGADVPVVSSLGAGDVFHGALLTALVRGEPTRRALAYANAAAALSCAGLDGRSRIPTHDEAAALAATLEEIQPCRTR